MYYKDLLPFAQSFLSLDVLLAKKIDDSDTSDGPIYSQIESFYYTDKDYPVLMPPFHISRIIKPLSAPNNGK